MTDARKTLTIDNVVDDLNLSGDADDLLQDPPIDQVVARTIEDDRNDIILWLTAQNKGRRPVSAKVTDDLLRMVVKGRISIVFDENDQVQMVPADSLKEEKPPVNPPRPSPSPTQNSSSSSDLSDPIVDYPNVRDRQRMAPAVEANLLHKFSTERSRLANITRISRNLGAINPFAPIAPEKIMRMENWPGWKTEEMQSQASDWSNVSSELLYQAMVYKNQLDLNTLRDGHELLKEARFYLLRSAWQDLGL